MRSLLEKNFHSNLGKQDFHKKMILSKELFVIHFRLLHFQRMHHVCYGYAKLKGLTISICIDSTSFLATNAF